MMYYYIPDRKAEAVVPMMNRGLLRSGMLPLLYADVVLLAMLPPLVDL